tara:strand:+ start:358 stop:1155 length:798 start_codon:yes stop_codon:yes gene_type:complete
LILAIYQEITINKQIVILLISFLSNLFSSISGGGAGLIQLPALLLLGMPYYQALALHKIATVFLGIGGTTRNLKNLKDDFSKVLQLVIFGIPGVVLGSSVVNRLSEDLLYFILGVFSVSIGFYTLFKTNFGLISINKKLSNTSKIRFALLIFFIGILNGSISSGTGLLVTILLIKTYGIDFLRAISITFLTVGIFWNASGAIALSRIGDLPLNILMILIIGSFSGGLCGAHLSNLSGNKFIKKFFTLLCFLIGITLILKTINNLF